MKAYIRHYQRTDDDGNPFYYDGTDALNIFKTTTPPTGFTNTYQDVSCDILNLSELTFTYSIEEGEQRPKFETSGVLEIVGQTAVFVRDWIYDRVYASQNIVEIKFVDDKCSDEIIAEMIIKAQKIRFCTSEGCQINVVAEANNRQYECLAKYAISDNWNGFQDRDYRAYDYVVEKHPKILTKILYMFGALIFIIGLGFALLAAPINGIIALINAIAGSNIPPIPGSTVGEIAALMRRLLGFGRSHSAASVAEYTQNVADRCGIPVDVNNNLFFQDELKLVDGSVVANPYKNLDILFARSEKGRRNDNADKRKIIPNNASLLTLPQLYNDLADWANGKWYISPQYGLRFLLSYTFADPIVYDYSAQQKGEEVNGVTWDKICVENAQNNPKLGKALEFSQDAIDLAGNDALPRYNSRVVLDANEDNPNLKGLEDVPINFGAARFRSDGILREFVQDAITDPLTALGVAAFTVFIAIQFLNALGNIITTGAAVITIIVIIALNITIYIAGQIWGISQYANVLQMSQDTCDKPKLLLWDGTNPDEARVVIQPNFPAPNPNNNTDPYVVVHPYNEDPIILHNYPVFLDCRFQGTAYSNLHSWEDRRNVSLVENTVEIEMVACCEHMRLLGLYQGLETAIDKRIGYATEYDSTGQALNRKEARTTRLEVNYTTKWVKIIAVGR